MADLWRYPVKSLAGERLRRAFLGPFGLLGDRRHAVVDVEGGEALTARRACGLLGFRARYVEGEAAESLVVSTPDGMALGPDDPELDAALGRAVGRAVTLVRHTASVHDAAPVHLVTLSSLAALGEWLGAELDSRRFRPNLVVELDDPEEFAEAQWPGRSLMIGDGAVLDVIAPTERCAVTTFDPDTLEREPAVLAALARERENFFGVYASVAAPGWIAVGDAIRLSPVREPRSHLA